MFYVVDSIVENIDEVNAGGLNKLIIRDLKTLKGVINRFNKYYPFKECTIFTFTNFYNDDTFKKVWSGSK